MSEFRQRTISRARCPLTSSSARVVTKRAKIALQIRLHRVTARLYPLLAAKFPILHAPHVCGLRSALYDLRLFGSLFLLKRSRTSCSCQLLRHQVKSRHSSEGGACLRSNHRLRRSVPLRVVPAISYDHTTRFSR